MGDCLIYLDDVKVVGRTSEHMIDNFSKVLDRIASADFKLKPKNCVLFSQVLYLGHVIADEFLSTDSEKVTAVQNWPEPCIIFEVNLRILQEIR